VEVNIHHITHSTNIKYNAKTGSFSTPLGVLTPDAISTARDLLNELKRLDGLKRKQKKKRADCVRDYFQLVPKDFGTKIPPVEELIATDEQFQEEAAILDALESAISTDNPAANGKQKLFECRLVKIPHYTDEGKELFRKTRDLYYKTRNTRHHPAAAALQMTRLYEVEIGEMKRRFDTAAGKLGNVRNDLWHGTRASNLLSILKHGLVIPPSNAAHCTGRLFGNGIYTSLQSTKALNYATDFWNRSGSRNQRTFMFLCEVALGKMHKPRTFGGGYPVRGTNSTWVEPGQGGVLNHECIVYDTSQINLRYLAEFGAK
jgi:poly [ADP-ribose] polymerase